MLQDEHPTAQIAKTKCSEPFKSTSRLRNYHDRQAPRSSLDSHHPHHHSLHHLVIKKDLYNMLDTDTKEGYEAQALELLKLPDEAVVTKETIARSGPFVSLSMFF